MTNEVIEVVAVAGKKDYTHMPMRESLVAKAAQLRGNGWTAEAFGGYSTIYSYTAYSTFIILDHLTLTNRPIAVGPCHGTESREEFHRPSSASLPLGMHVCA